MAGSTLKRFYAIIKNLNGENENIFSVPLWYLPLNMQDNAIRHTNCTYDVVLPAVQVILTAPDFGGTGVTAV